MLRRRARLLAALLATCLTAPPDAAPARSRSSALEHGEGTAAARPKPTDQRRRKARRSENRKRGAPRAPSLSASAAAPLPPPRPGRGRENAAAPEPSSDRPPTQAVVPPASGVPPIPSPKPQNEADRPAEAKGPPAPPSTTHKPVPATELPAEERACRDRLRSLGAAFEERPPEADALGCSLPHPLFLTKLSASITVEPGALLNCALAEAATRFTQGPLAQAAREDLHREVTGIDQASAYACRPRHGIAKLSEHAFGNALDIARFRFADGHAIEVGAATDKAAAAFLARVREAACGPFRTVLGPGSDSDHAAHLHLDLQPRRNGAVLCR